MGTDPREFDLVVFDLDGTLTDSAPAIVSGIEAALLSLGVSIPDNFDWQQVLGPPLRTSFVEHFDVPEAQVEAAYRIYVEYCSTDGLADVVVYDDIADLLRQLAENGHHLAVATAKRSALAEAILEHVGLRGLFLHVDGAFADGTGAEKHEVLGRALSALPRTDPTRAAMVGDRRHDIEAARMHCIQSIGVTWGYAASGELEAARPDHLVSTVSELRDLLGVRGTDGQR
jgi:phosphoglycolate phosphatase